MELKEETKQPLRSTYLPYGQQWVDDEDIEWVMDILRGDYLTTGPTVQMFEQAVADYVGAKYAIAFSNGTAALHAACFAAGIGEGDEVITTPLTFAASANCVLYQQGRPIFADVDAKTYNIDPDAIQSLINSRTKAIIPVDFTGQPADLDAILRIARKHNLVVIEDAAHALGAEYKGKKIGSISDLTTFSFHPVKPITTGEGGLVTTNSKLYYEKLCLFRSHGITRDRSQMIADHGPWYYEMHELGFNYRLTDIQAALGLSQLKKLDNFIDRRRHYASLYTEAFKEIPAIIPPYQAAESLSGWHLYILRLRLDQLAVDRKTIFNALQHKNIGVNVHYIPVYYHPYYQELGYTRGLCPQAEKMYEEIITLPLFPKMTEEDIQDVITAVHQVISRYSK